VDARDPIWHPDGDLLAFTVAPAAGADAGVWTVLADGTDPRKITSSIAPGDGYAFSAPSWSPSGRHLTYGCCPGPHDIWTVDLAGAEQRITTDPADEYWPTWSSTDRIAFQRQLVADRPENDVIVLQPDGSNPIRLDIEPSGGISPMVWSPDALELLAYTSYSSELMIASVEGLHPAYKIPAPNASFFGTAWSWQRVP
jgi:Tol biopolymer transport system component